MVVLRSTSCFACVLGVAVVLLISSILVAPIRAEENPFGGGKVKDPFGGGDDDPFGGGDDDPDPFGGGDDDPFGGVEDDDPFGGGSSDDPFAAHLARSQRMALVLIAKMSDSDDPAVFLDATLSRLPDAARLSQVGLMEKLMRFPWPRQPGDTPQDVLTRVYQHHARNGNPLSRRLKDCRVIYLQFRGKPASFDWPAAGDHWGKVFVEALAAADADDLPNHIRSRIKSKSLNEDLLRAIYLAALRVRHRPWDAEKTWDFELARPWMRATDDYSFLAFHRTGEVLASLIAARAPAGHPDRARLEKQLLAYLVDPDCRAEHICQDDGPLGRLWRLDRRLGHTIATILLDRYGSPWWHFAQAASMERQHAEDLFWGHEITFDVKDLPLRTALARVVGKRVWVDAAVAADPAKITLRISASRMAVLETLLADTDCQMVRLTQGIVWVGPQQNRAAAEECLRDAFRRVPLGDSPVRKALAAGTEIEFIETPLQDVCDYLSDVHSVQVEASHDVNGRPITQQLKHMPLLLALTLLTEAADLRWTTAENMIFIGEKESIAAFGQLHEWWQHRRIRLRKLELAGCEVASATFEPTTLEFIETPLQDVCDYLADLHSHPFVVLSPAHKDTPMTDNLSGHGLGWTLTFMLWRADLTWDTDDEIVVVGQKSDVARFRKLADTRPQRRSAYPEKLAGKLQSKYDLEAIESSLKFYCDELSTESGVTITPTKEAIRANHKITVDTGQYPLDVVLDLIGHQHGLTWEIRDGQIVLLPDPLSSQTSPGKCPSECNTKGRARSRFFPRG